VRYARAFETRRSRSSKARAPTPRQRPFAIAMFVQASYEGGAGRERCQSDREAMVRLIEKLLSPLPLTQPSCGGLPEETTRQLFLPGSWRAGLARGSSAP